jgi:hypothetical protein
MSFPPFHSHVIIILPVNFFPFGTKNSAELWFIRGDVIKTTAEFIANKPSPLHTRTFVARQTAQQVSCSCLNSVICLLNAKVLTRSGGGKK